MITNILWDNDGVLVDTERFYFQATIDTIADIGIQINKEQYIEYSLKESKGVWHLAVEKGLHPDSINDLKNKRNRLYNHLIRKEDITFPDVEKSLLSLYDSCRMAIVTTSRKVDFEAIHERTGYLKYFDFWLTVEDYKKSKPDPDPYLTALKKMDVKPDETVVVEDTQRGLIAATAAGLRCFIIPNDLSKHQDFTQAYRVLDSITKVKEIITNM